MYLYKDMGCYSIANYLNDNRVLTPRMVAGASNVGVFRHQSTVQGILTNPIYTGTLAHHQEEVKVIVTKRRKKVSENEQIVFEDNHEAIVTKEEF